MASGRVRRRLPARATFSKSGHWPMLSGRVSMWLAVSTSQRSVGGKADAGTWRMRLDLKPTMRNCGQAPRCSGSSVKSLSEQNKMRRWRKRLKSGSSRSRLPLRLSTCNVSARSNTSGGRLVSPPVKSRRVAPVSWPVRRRFKVSMGIGDQGATRRSGLAITLANRGRAKPRSSQARKAGKAGVASNHARST